MPNFPRLRALALFGRRLQERADSLAIPATENLHSTGLMHCNNRKCSSIVSVASDRNKSSTVRPIACDGSKRFGALLCVAGEHVYRKIGSKANIWLEKPSR